MSMDHSTGVDGTGLTASFGNGEINAKKFDSLDRPSTADLTTADGRQSSANDSIETSEVVESLESMPLPSPMVKTLFVSRPEQISGLEIKNVDGPKEAQRVLYATPQEKNSAGCSFPVRSGYSGTPRVLRAEPAAPRAVYTNIPVVPASQTPQRYFFPRQPPVVSVEPIYSLPANAADFPGGLSTRGWYPAEPLTPQCAPMRSGEKMPIFEVEERVLELPSCDCVKVPPRPAPAMRVPFTQPQLARVERIIEPRVTHRIIEKEFETPRIIHHEVPVTIRREEKVPVVEGEEKVPVVLGRRVDGTIVRQSDETIEVPITRIIPEFVPVKVSLPNKLNPTDLANCLQGKVRVQRHFEGLVPIEDPSGNRFDYNIPDLPPQSFVEEVAEPYLAQAAQIACDLATGALHDGDMIPGAPVLGNGNVENHFPAPADLSLADYNSWLLLLNEHLRDFEDMPHDALLDYVPFLKSANGEIQFLPSGTPMRGQIVEVDRA